MYDCDEKEFNKFQNKYIKKHFDDYCDGKAVNRLKEHLCINWNQNFSRIYKFMQNNKLEILTFSEITDNSNSLIMNTYTFTHWIGKILINLEFSN